MFPRVGLLFLLWVNSASGDPGVISISNWKTLGPPAGVSINSLPCVKAKADGAIVCTPKVMVVPDPAMHFVRQVVADPEKKARDWGIWGVNVLAAFVFEPALSQPQLLVYPYGDGMSLFIKLPLNITDAQVTAWMASEGRKQWAAITGKMLLGFTAANEAKLGPLAIRTCDGAVERRSIKELRIAPWKESLGFANAYASTKRPTWTEADAPEHVRAFTAEYSRIDKAVDETYSRLDELKPGDRAGKQDLKEQVKDLEQQKRDLDEELRLSCPTCGLSKGATRF